MLRDNLSSDYQLGLILTGGPFTVIDIDNYQTDTDLDYILAIMLHKGAYIEVSPGGKVLHVFFWREWLHARKKGIFSLGTREKK